HRLLQLAGLRIERVSPTTPAARWCVNQYFAELNRRFEHGFDPAASISVEGPDFRPPVGAFLLASIDGEPVGCGALQRIASGVASLKRMGVAESVRGLGIGRRMLSALEGEAWRLGFRIARLETNKALKEAIQLYRQSGYREIPAFNDEPYAS